MAFKRWIKPKHLWNHLLSFVIFFKVHHHSYPRFRPRHFQEEEEALQQVEEVAARIKADKLRLLQIQLRAQDMTWWLSENLAMNVRKPWKMLTKGWCNKGPSVFLVIWTLTEIHEKCLGKEAIIIWLVVKGMIANLSNIFQWRKAATNQLWIWIFLVWQCRTKWLSSECRRFYGIVGPWAASFPFQRDWTVSDQGWKPYFSSFLFWQKDSLEAKKLVQEKEAAEKKRQAVSVANIFSGHQDEFRNLRLVLAVQQHRSRRQLDRRRCLSCETLFDLLISDLNELVPISQKPMQSAARCSKSRLKTCKCCSSSFWFRSEFFSERLDEVIHSHWTLCLGGGIDFETGGGRYWTEQSSQSCSSLSRQEEKNAKKKAHGFSP